MEGNTNKEVVSINQRSLFSMNGVTNIESLDSGCVILNTSGSNIIVEGDLLKVISLDKNSGDVVIKGNIFGVFFEMGDKKKKRKHDLGRK